MGPSLLRRLPLPLLLALLLPLLLLWPLPIVGVDRAVGDPLSEPAEHLWGWWAAWQEGSLLSVHTALLNYPDGFQLQLIDPTHAAIWRLGAWISPAVGYDLVLWAGLAVAGVAGALLASEAGAGRGGQVVAVVAAASCPTLVTAGADGITEGLGVAWVGLQLALLLALRRGATPARVAALVAALVIGVYAGPYNAIWMAALDVPVGLAMLRRTRAPLLAGALAGALCVPFALSLADMPADQAGGSARVAAELPPQVENWRGSWRDGADLLDLFVPAPLTGTPADAPATGYLGVVTLALALAGARRREAWPWLGGALVFAAIALGPWVTVGGSPVSLGAGHLAGPAAWLEKVGPLGRMTRWYRAAAVALFLLLPVVARAADGRRAVVVSLAILLDARLLSPVPFPLPTWSVAPSPALALADGPIAEIPPRDPKGVAGQAANENLVYQIFHGQPTSGTLHNPGPAEMANDPALRIVERALLGRGGDLPGALHLVERRGYRWLAVYPPRLEAPSLAPLEEIAGPPVARDGRVALFRLSRGNAPRP